MEKTEQTLPLPLEQNHAEGSGNGKEEGRNSPTAPSAAFNQLHYPHCWSRIQVDYFLSTYPWIMILEGKIGCRVFKERNGINMFCDHGMHLSKEWVNCKISSDAEKGVAQMHHRKKIVKHANSRAHLTANKIYWRERRKRLKVPQFLVCIINEKPRRDA